MKTDDRHHTMAKKWLENLLVMTGENVRDRQETVLGVLLERLAREVAAPFEKKVETLRIALNWYATSIPGPDWEELGERAAKALRETKEPVVIMWGGNAMVEGVCPAIDRCLACQRLGKHLEPA